MNELSVISEFNAVVFDLDGTLVNSDSMVAKSFDHALEPYGVKIMDHDREIIRSRHPHKIFEGYLAEEFWQEAFGRLVEYGVKHVGDIPAFEGVSVLLKRLHERGIKMAIWTGRDVKSAREILEANGLLSYFSCTVGGCMVTRNKPYPDGLLMVSKNVQVAPAKIIMVGDHLHDLQGSKTAGAYFIGAAWSPNMRPGYFEGTPVDRVFKQISEMESWLLSQAFGQKIQSE